METRKNPNKKPNYKFRQAVAGLAGVAALAGGHEIVSAAVSNPSHEIKVTEPGTPGTEVITVRHGDTAWEIADQRTPDDKDVRPLVDDIMRQADAQRNPGLEPGEQIVVPKVHD